MLRNYLKIAARNLRRHKGYAFINVTGLAVSIACCLLIVLFVRDELSYDRFHEQSDRIHRIVSDWGDFSIPSTNPPLVRSLIADYPEITVAPVLRNEAYVRQDDRQFTEVLHITRPTFFEVFSYDLLQGSEAEALERPFTAVVTPEVASRYFGNEDPIGRTLSIDNQYDVEITGVIEPAPQNAHFAHGLLLSFATLDAVFDYSNSSNWGNNSIYAYLLLPDGMQPGALESQFPELIERHAGGNWNGATLSLQPLTDIHLRSHHNMELSTNSNVAYVYVFSAIALFLLLVACINFMNLSTARAADRAREVGVRKVVGAERSQLIRQFISESLLLSLVALILAFALTAVALPAFRALSGKSVSLTILTDGFTLAALVGISLLVGVLAGSYPAFVLSGFRPAEVLKGATSRGTRGARLRRVLVVFQFATSIFLIVGTLVVYRQLDYLQSASLGFDKDQVLVLPLTDNSQVASYQPFKQVLQQHANVLDVSIASEGLPSELLNGNGTAPAGTEVSHENFLEVMVPTRTVAVGHDFFEALGVEMMVGRSFSTAYADSGAYILNATAARMLSDLHPDRYPSPESAVGTEIQLGTTTGELVGIAEDFNMSSLHEGIEPIIFFFNAGWYDHLLVRLAPGDFRNAVTDIQLAWNDIYPEWPFNYAFADQSFDAQYRAEDRLAMIFTTFAALAIFIACLGLFGLASFTTQQRTKEIGVRKVLGASVPQIVALLSREYTILVAVAFLVATPLAFLAMNSWLEGFAYRTDVSLWIFLLAGAVAVLIAWLTVSYQSIRASLTNPVRALRYE